MPALHIQASKPANHLDRRIAYGCVLLGVFILAFRLAMWQGFFTAIRAVRISGGSMGENLPGEHVRLQCPDCGFKHRVDAESWRRTSGTTCPNCCWTRIEHSETDRVEPGTRVLVDRAAYIVSPPQRFDVAAFKQPNTNNELAVKRVIGLPGETLCIHRGDLYINDQLLRKTPAEFRSQAILMHDDRYRKNEQASFWSGWMKTATGHICQRTATEATPVDWLKHIRTHKFGIGIEHSAPLRDHDSFHAASYGGSHKLTDFAVQGSFQLTGHSKLHFQLHDGYTWHEKIWSNHQRTEAKTHTFLWGYWDQTLWFLVDDKLVAQTENKPRTTLPPDLHLDSQLKIGGAGEGSITLNNLQIWRDLYYLSPIDRDEPWQVSQPLAANEYFVLGDNQPLSIDSRHWQQGINRSDFLGKVFDVANQ